MPSITPASPVAGDRSVAHDLAVNGPGTASIRAVKDRANAESRAAANAESVRVQRLREDARRPINVNLAEGIALSHKLMRFTGAARKN